ncbi:MAG: class I SAM-dependent methyltransferase [Candidatus Atribacteria bacterium]|nr:class I SAM-dependent methyltransferase [Candidatus Atribacteria bacterium]
MDRDIQHRIYWNAGVKKEKRRERHIEKKVHTDLVWMEIEPYLYSGMKVLDAGGGYGRYGLEIARRGCELTLLDISSAMLREAKNLAQKSGIHSIRFVEGRVQNLFQFSGQCFDLVLCLDAPVSYAYPDHFRAIQEICRVSRERVIISVVNRLGQLPIAIELEMGLTGSLNQIRSFLEKGNWDHPEKLQRIERRVPFLSRYVFPPLHAFLPQELIDMVIEQNFQPVRIMATGTLARLLKTKTLQRIVNNQKAYQYFLKMSREYDSQFEVLGVGARSASGLLIIAERNKNGSNLEEAHSKNKG